MGDIRIFKMVSCFE